MAFIPVKALNSSASADGPAGPLQRQSASASPLFHPGTNTVQHNITRTTAAPAVLWPQLR